MTRKIVIKYGELWLKSNQIRIIFAKKLMRNIKSMLRMNDIDFELIRERDRMVITTEEIEKAVSVLKNVFGIVNITIVEEVFNDFEDIKEKILELAKDIPEDATFAIRATRKNKKYPHNSIEIEKMLADHIDRKVDLKNPDKKIFLTIRHQTADIYTEKIPGQGGLPVSASGRMLCLLSTGIDSPVAAWMLMKRGVIIDFITFYDEEKGKTQKKLMEEIKKYSPRDMRLYRVKYGPIQSKIKRWARKYTCVFCKRFMYKIASVVAKENGYEALITGENLSQVASQTISNLTTQQKELDIPVLRPLLAFDKTDIMDLAEKIGTFSISEKGKGKCPYVPDSPATKSDESDIFHIEKHLDVKDIVKEAAESAEMEIV